MPAAMAVGVQPRMFPKRVEGGPRHQKREAGKRKPAITFRVPDHLLDFVLDAEDAGHTRTAVVVRMMEVARDAAAALEEDWWELEKLAARENSTPGTILGRLARETLESEGKPRKTRK
jgi:hypothetical protein